LTAPDSILVVDDDPDSRDMLVEYLRLCGFVVHEAEDGFEAIEIAMRIHPRIILMDLMMPRMDGWEATRLLKADARTWDITVVAVSALSLTSEQKQVTRLAGLDDFIAKPYHLVDLVVMLRHVLTHRLDSDGAARAAFVVDSAETDPPPPHPLREHRLPSLDEAIASDIAVDNAIAAAIRGRACRRD
jgi:two-component system cell cycle response regulator DivK